MSCPLLITSTRANIIAQLQKDILPLQGFKRISNQSILDILPRVIKNAFPNAESPLGTVHEFTSMEAEDAASTSGLLLVYLLQLCEVVCDTK